MIATFIGAPREGRECNALAARTVRWRGQFQRARLHGLVELLRFGNVVHQFPIPGAVGAHALGGGAEHVRQVAPHLALVHQPRQPSGARQHAEQRHFGQAHRARAVVDHRDLVAGERELVAAAGGGAVQRGEELEPGMARRVLDAVARLVGELAEVHFPGMRRQAEHVDVGAGAEHAALAAREHHAAHFRVLEADAVERIVQLDVDAEVVGIELELVARRDALVFGDVERERRQGAVEAELPVVVALGCGIEGDHAFSSARRSSASDCLRGRSEVSSTASARE